MTEEQIAAAARASSMHDRILSFPDKYETRVGERGQRLSGGEKQRSGSFISFRSRREALTFWVARQLRSRGCCSRIRQSCFS